MLVAACFDTPNQPRPPVTPEPEHPVTLDLTEIQFSRLGDSARVVARKGPTQQTEQLRYTIREERRYLHDRPVLDDAALGRSLIRALAPGSVTLAVEALGSNTPLLLSVTVAPAGPIVLAVADETSGASESRAVLRGYRLNAIPNVSIRLGDVQAEILSADSANLSLRFPAVAGASACDGATPTSPLHITGVEVVQPLSIHQPHRVDLSLAIGEVRRMRAVELACLHLAPVSAAYAVVYADASLVRAAEFAPESAGQPFTVRFEHRGPISAAAAKHFLSIPARTEASGAPHVFFQNSSEGDPRNCAWGWDLHRDLTCAPRPLAVGDSLELFDAERASIWYRAVRVDNAVVFLVPIADAARFTTDAATALDRAMKVISDNGFPLYRMVFTSTQPITSPGSGQLLFFLYPESTLPCHDTVACVYSTGQSASSGGQLLYSRIFQHGYVSLDRVTTRNLPYLVSLLGHELAHAWQLVDAYERLPAEATFPDIPSWEIEGVATFIEHEINRRWAGVAPDANFAWDFASNLPEHQRAYAQLASGGAYDFIRGYGAVASFLHDLAARRSQAGESWEDALRASVLAGMEGWYGQQRAYTEGDRMTYKSQGLTARMRQRLGATWDPVQALLDWTMSNAIDDLTSDPFYQNRAFLNVSNAHDGIRPWHAHATFRTGSGVINAALPAGAMLTDRSVAHTWPAGSTGFFFIQDDGHGGSYAISTSRPGVEWMVARYR